MFIQTASCTVLIKVPLRVTNLSRKAYIADLFFLCLFAHQGNAH
jgi:hypothetical protein